jgi:FkbM family methyltransferase
MMIKDMIPQSMLMPLIAWKAVLSGEPELRLVRCICNRLESSVDVGANRGIYSYLFSKYSDQVLAIEPHPEMAERLRHSLPDTVRVLNVAASDQEGECEFHIPLQFGRDVDSRCSLEVDVNREFATRIISVERLRLDKLPIDPCKVGAVKIDVEGHELNALRGMAGVMDRSRPTVIVESEARHHASSPQDVFEFFRDFEYRGYFVHRGRLRDIGEFSVEKFQVHHDPLAVDAGKSPDYVNNFIFIHPSRTLVLNRVKQVFPLSSEERPMTPRVASREKECA